MQIFSHYSVSSYCFEFCHNTCTIVIGEQPWRTTTGHEVILLSLVNNKYLITNHTQIPRNLSINLTKWHPNEKKSSFRTSWSNIWVDWSPQTHVQINLCLSPATINVLPAIREAVGPNVSQFWLRPFAKFSEYRKHQNHLLPWPRQRVSNNIQKVL